MTAVAILPVSSAVAAGKTGVKSDGKSASGFGDALQNLLAGTAAPEAGKQQFPAPAEEEVPNGSQQLAAFTLAQAVPAQLILPAAAGTVPATAGPVAPATAASVPGKGQPTVGASAPANSAAAMAATGVVPAPASPPGTPAAQAPSAAPATAAEPTAVPAPGSKAQGPAKQTAAATSAEPVNGETVPVRPGLQTAAGLAVPTPADPAAKEAKAGTAATSAAAVIQAEESAPAPAAGDAAAPPQILQAAAGLAVPKPADPAAKPVKAGATATSVAAAVSAVPSVSPAPAMVAFTGVVPAAALEAAVPVQTAIIQSLISQAVAAAPAQAGGVPDAVAAAPVTAFGTDTSQAFAQVASPAQIVPATTLAAPAAPAASVPVPQGYTAQLAKPVFSLATAGVGDHTMTVSVNPDNLGPVTVQAHIGAGGIRIELFAASADGRDVLRQALPELKRDLAGAGINASLDLSSNAQSGSPQGGQDRESFARRFATSNHAPDNGRPLEVKDQTVRTRVGLNSSETVLDVMA